MYFARLSENFMSVCDKYFHFVFNITGNTKATDVWRSFFASRAFQGEVYSIRASISPQSPSSLYPESLRSMGYLPTESEILQFRTPRRWLFRQFFLGNSPCCMTLLQNESTKTRFHWKSVVGFRDWLAENRKLSCFRIYIKRSAKWVSGSKNRYHVLVVPRKPPSAQVHAQQRGSI